ncbi:MAG: hypothetical protein IJV82_03235 [Oscillospiraceae bacterium]|nr:hypothetical protein [Oscillospiraceae bacterium]
MKDIPFFTTDQGVASLMLGEIPYRQEAYIQIQDVQPGQLETLVQECVGFCRAAGAERVYWSAEGAEGALHASVFEMRAVAWVDKAMLESLFPVTEPTVARWRQIYNERMRNVDNAATMTAFDEKKIVESGGAYFVHHEGELLGIGWLEDTKLLAMAAVQKGAGLRVMHTLMSLVEGADMTLEVASTNDRAVALYETLGFVKTKELRKWYLGFEKKQ